MHTRNNEIAIMVYHACTCIEHSPEHFFHRDMNKKSNPFQQDLDDYILHRQVVDLLCYSEIGTIEKLLINKQKFNSLIPILSQLQFTGMEWQEQGSHYFPNAKTKQNKYKTEI